VWLAAWAVVFHNATSVTGVPGYPQTFQYNRAGSMTDNGRVGAYAYGTAKPRHAPVTVTKGGTVTTFAYDANGNMTAGLDGKAMTYDGENRPLSVTRNGKMTCYVYGADGSRLKKIENMAPAANCNAAPTGSTPVTVYFANVEIRNYGQGATAEQVITYPAPAVRVVTTSAGTAASILHRDQLGSVRGLTGWETNQVGKRTELSTYRPFGEQDESPANPPINETKGFIGERYDADAGLQYLNARYYDPKLGLFLQPDWWEVTEPGVGTNRFAYAGNDPVNLRDPGGHEWWNDWNDFKEAVGNFGSGHVNGAAANANFDKTVWGAGLGAAGGALVGAVAGTSVGCGVAACAGSTVTGPVGAEAGFWLGGAAGGAAGVVVDGLEIVGGGLRGGIDAVREGRVLSQGSEGDDSDQTVSEDNESSKSRPSGSKSIDKTKWSGDHRSIKEGITAGPKDKVVIDPEDNVWSENPDGSWTFHGYAGDYTGSGKASGRRGKDREPDWK
jgi:RHS repeat-associated protein